MMMELVTVDFTAVMHPCLLLSVVSYPYYTLGTRDV
jgi:hypothetical protein